MTADPLPCPFCGAPPEVDSKPGATGEQHFVVCVTESCVIFNAEAFNTHARREDAVAAWNRRSPGGR